MPGRKPKSTKRPAVKVKGVNIGFLTKRQQTAMKKHSKHHTGSHIRNMANAMKKGASFSESHRIAMKKGR